jgi:hypothetical protein
LLNYQGVRPPLAAPYKALILQNKTNSLEYRPCPATALPGRIDCVFFTQHIPEIAQTGL